MFPNSPYTAFVNYRGKIDALDLLTLVNDKMDSKSTATAMFPVRGYLPRRKSFGIEDIVLRKSA